jgi:ribosomal protein L11 methyltransferase
MLVWRKISSEKWTDSWQERLLFLGWERLVVTHLAGSSRIRLEIFELSQQEAKLLLKRFGGEVRNLQKSTADWVRAVVQKRPISIRGRLTIFNREPEPGRPVRDCEIFLPAGLAFGTGDHATTAGCLRLLCDIAPRSGGWRLLDTGTGAGILSIAAAKLGAAQVDAFDIDPTAVRIAKQNAKLNRLPIPICFWKQDVFSFIPKFSYDVVTANLYSELLCRAAPRICQALRPDGYLIASGVMRDQTAQIQQLLKSLGTPVRLTRTRGKWVTLLAQRNRQQRRQRTSERQ